MKALFYVLVVLAAPAWAQAGESFPPGSLMDKTMPWPPGAIATATNDEAAATNTDGSLLPTIADREQVLDFATTPLFLQWGFQLDDRLPSSWPGLCIEKADTGEPFIATPVGLGLSETEAGVWLAVVSDNLLTHFDLFEFAYRAALVPRAHGGPGLTFREARQAALKLTLTGEEWPSPSGPLVYGGTEPAWVGSLQVGDQGRRFGMEPCPSSPTRGYPDPASSIFGLCGGYNGMQVPVGPSSGRR